MNTDKLAQIIISAIVVLGFGGVLVAWMVAPPHTGEGSNLLTALTTALGTGYLQVINFWFGASAKISAPVNNSNQ
jgi:hypothetical protein